LRWLLAGCSLSASQKMQPAAVRKDILVLDRPSEIVAHRYVSTHHRLKDCKYANK
jgi:hypothetical protein